MEKLDIVDSRDQVVGQALRAEIHDQGLMHRACHMLLFNSAGQLFLQKRSMAKDNDPGLWDSSAAGHVDAGESYIGCAVRELEEELGLVVTPDDLSQQFKLPPIPATGMEFSVVYTLVSDDELSLDPEEIDDGIWLDTPEIDLWVADQPDNLSYAFKLIWSRLQSN